tara:strand:- start:141638 stop:142489 length:852 start_codon:yes stop_codon:yes gene_type:complete
MLHINFSRLAVVPMFVIALCLSASETNAQTPSPTEKQTPSPTENSLSDTAWYDADQKQTVPIQVRDESQDSINRDSRWLPKPEKLKQAKPATTGGGATGSTGLFGSGLTLGYLMGWTLAIIFVACVVAAFVYAVSSASFDAGANRGGNKSGNGESYLDEQTLARMKHLPAELRRTDVNMRDEAERLMNAGQFDQAIILLFGHQLLLLDQAGYLRLNRSKTNGRYVRETRGTDPTSAERLRETVDQFERSYFGRHEISRDEFLAIWLSNQALESDLAAATGAAA